MADTDSLCTLMEQCSLLEKEKTRFLSQLADFPNTFQLQNQDQLSTSQLKRFKSGLESALSAGYKTTLETARAKNLLSYCLFRLNDSEKALQQLDVVIKMDAHNLVTLANKAIILWNQQRLSEADDFVASLTQMKTQVDDFHYLVVRANAELAFTYTRLGPSFSHCAIAKFEEVLPRARESEKWLWKFGLALTRRRALRASPEHVSVRPSEHSAAEKRDLLLLFKEIAENCSSKNLKAKTYAEMASLLYMVSKTPLRNEFYFRARLNPEQACEKALHLDSNDNSVLCKCGKLFRYFRRTEESRDLLEKALTIRPSSTAYHHLGLTYKALANKEKYKDQVKVPGYYRQLEEQQKTARGAQNMNRGNQQFRQLSAGRPQYSRGESSSYRRAMGSAAAACDTGDGLTYSLNRDVRVMQRMIKSPPKGVTRYSRNDKFITETLQNLEKAVQFSEGMNTPALYDLALLHKSLGELEEAKENLKEIMLKQQSTMFAADRINAYEQLGCVLQELAESTTDTVTREHMFHDRNTMLYYAVKISSQVFSRSLGVKEHLGELYSSFSVLLQDVERSDHEPSRKLQEKARLFQLINDHPHCLEVLQELKQMDPQKCEEPQYLKQVIESHVAIGQFMEALVYVELIKCTAQSTTIMELFEDKHYVVKIYVQAARQALLNGSSTAKLHFKYAFDEATATNLDENSSSGCEDTDSSEDSKAETWDVGIVCEETDEALTNATILSELLEETLGLKVAIPCRDAPPNKSDLEGELQMLLKSTVVIVMTGSKPSRKNRLFLHNIAKRPSTVALLVDGDHLPKLLKTNRSLVCPPGLLHSSSTAACRKMTESEADTICEFFSFLVIDSNTQEA